MNAKLNASVTLYIASNRFLQIQTCLFKGPCPVKTGTKDAMAHINFEQWVPGTCSVFKDAILTFEKNPITVINMNIYFIQLHIDVFDLGK